MSIRSILKSAALCCAAVLSLNTARAQSQEKPNILYIVADDLGWKDTGFQGSKEIKTPNLDKLAAGGMRMEQFYVQPMCTPTRAALMTGRYPMRYGLQTLVIPSKGLYGLSLEERTLPQVLKESGYHTAMVGKWHLGHAEKAYLPMQRGFDYHYGAAIGEIDYFTRRAHGVLDWQRNNKTVEEKGYVTQLLGKDAVRVIQEQDAKKPLFLYLAFTAPHAPYQAPEDYLKRYSNIEDPSRRAYAAQITCLDDEVGKVIAALEKKKMIDNTLIVFHSDNGGTKSKMFAGEGDVSKIKIPCDNGTLNGGKGELYEGGTRVPAFVSWKGHIQPGSTAKGMIHIVDMLPTLAEVAGASTTKCKPLDGISAWPTLSEGKPSSRQEIVYNIEPQNAAIREGDWKLVWRTVLPAKIELFNIAQDPDEKNNLADSNPEMVKELQAKIQTLSTQAAKPLFMESSLKAIYAGLFGEATIATDED
jgi:arylsulfatase B